MPYVLNFEIFLSVWIRSRYFLYMTESGFLISKVFWPAFFYPKTLAAVFIFPLILSVFLAVRLLHAKKKLRRAKSSLHVCEEALEALPDGC